MDRGQHVGAVALTKEAVSLHTCMVQAQEEDRIPVYTLGGQQVGLPMGKREHFGKIPKRWTVQELLGSRGWIEVLRIPENVPVRDVHYKILDPVWRPKAVLLNQSGEANYIVGLPADCVGWYNASSLTVLTTDLQLRNLPLWRKGVTPYADDIPTPASPASSVDSSDGRISPISHPSQLQATSNDALKEHSGRLRKRRAGNAGDGCHNPSKKFAKVADSRPAVNIEAMCKLSDTGYTPVDKGTALVAPSVLVSGQ